MLLYEKKCNDVKSTNLFLFFSNVENIIGILVFIKIYVYKRNNYLNWLKYLLIDNNNTGNILCE